MHFWGDIILRPVITWNRAPLMMAKSAIDDQARAPDGNFFPFNLQFKWQFLKVSFCLRKLIVHACSKSAWNCSENCTCLYWALRTMRSKQSTRHSEATVRTQRTWRPSWAWHPPWPPCWCPTGRTAAPATPLAQTSSTPSPQIDDRQSVSLQSKILSNVPLLTCFCLYHCDGFV